MPRVLFGGISPILAAGVLDIAGPGWSAVWLEPAARLPAADAAVLARSPEVTVDLIAKHLAGGPVIVWEDEDAPMQVHRVGSPPTAYAPSPELLNQVLESALAGEMQCRLT